MIPYKTAKRKRQALKKEEYVFYPSKRQLVLQVLVNLGLLVPGILLILLGTEVLFLGVLGVLYSPFFVFMVVYFLYRLVKGNPSIIITDDYLYDNGGIFGVGRIYWEEVESTLILKGGKHEKDSLVIEVVDPDAILRRLGKGKQMVIGMLNKFQLHAFYIPQETLNIPLKDLQKIVERKRRKKRVRRG